MKRRGGQVRETFGTGEFRSSAERNPQRKVLEGKRTEWKKLSNFLTREKDEISKKRKGKAKKPGENEKHCKET